MLTRKYLSRVARLPTLSLIQHRGYMWSTQLANVTDLSIAKEVSSVQHHEHYSMYGGSDLKVERSSCDPSKHVIIDVSHPQAYKRGHIPGARNLPLETFDFTQPLDRYHITEDDVIQQLIGVGVSDDTEDIILYDNSAMLATRLWFVLRHFGFTARVFNGGWRAYAASKLPIETGNPYLNYFHCAFELTPKSGKDNKMIINPEQFAIQHETETSTFVDCREADAYKKFHIPHAINIPYEEFVLEGQYRDVEKMKKKWEASGLNIKRGRVVCYSEHNVSATVAYFGLSQLIGSQNVCVFEGGIKAWRQLSSRQLSPEALEHLGMGG